MNQIIPAILAADAQDFREKFSSLDEIADAVQLDVLNDTLYPNTSWCDMDVLDALDTPVWIELHLMVSNPAAYIDQIKSGGPINRVIWHIEAPVDHAELVLSCEHLGVETGLAIAPTTPIDALSPFIDRVDEILVLGVQPGFSGQALIPETIQMVREIHTRWPHVIIGFDGGVTAEHIPTLRDAGVTRFCAASSIWKSADPAEAVTALAQI